MKILAGYGTPIRGIASAASLAEAVSTMTLFDVGALAVAENDTLVGIISERDVMRALAQGADLATTPVVDVQSSGPVWLGPDDDAERARELMARLGVRHLPVVEHGEVVGMFSIRDLLRLQFEVAS